MKGREPWNKGFTKSNHESLMKLSNAKIGKTISEEIKIKISCTQQKIKVEDFKGFTNSNNDKDRRKIKGRRLNKQCFEKANYTCDISGVRGIKLNAHHLESFCDNKELRFELDNLVCISEKLHKLFHKKHGKGNNTKEQYEEFKKEWRINNGYLG